MTLVLRSILAAALAFSISCSSGGGGGDGTGTGAGGNTKTDNSAFTNVAGTAKGQWSDGDTLSLFISDSRMKLVGKCENNQSVEAEVGIKLTANTITFLESRTTGSGNCSIDFKKDTVLNYSVNGDELFIQMDEQKQLAFTRIGSATNTTPGAGTGGTTMTFEFYTSQNCTGQKMIYTGGMNCNELGGNISSLKQPGQQCQNTNTPQDSRAFCNSINQQLAQQGRQ
ncbi:MAG: hypothetical protein B7Y39_03405 [Bdellovibrio sp. 28-41-41]|nr:MAG: hypothetical protein B7Y39_03405 [Bdellovibrio sp. 28-41-41]